MSVGGEIDRFDELLQVVYGEIHRIAANYMKYERPGLTLQTTALIHEVYLRLHDKGISWESQAHFVRIYALAMRRFLIDQSRKPRIRNPVQIDPSRLTEIATKEVLPLEETIALAELIEKLAERHPRAASVLELHVFGGLTFLEIGEQLGVSDRQAKRDWVYARCWLKMRLEGQAS